LSDLLSPLSAPIALFYVGIDWAAEIHSVCVLDDTGRVKSTFTITPQRRRIRRPDPQAWQAR